jgi:hypothetical protein
MDDVMQERPQLFVLLRLTGEDLAAASPFGEEIDEDGLVVPLGQL